jgi:hypothetical protein
MSDTAIARFRTGIERCECKAATARNREMESLWLYAAEDYRYLLDHEQRGHQRGTWEWNAATVERKGE